MEQLEQIGKFLGGVAAILTAVVIPLFLIMRKRVSRLIAWFTFIAQVPERHNKVIEDIREMGELLRKELKPNGGSSLYDCIKELRVQAAIADSKWKVLTSQLNLICFQSDQFGKYIWVSEPMLEMLGLQDEDVLGDAWKSIISEDEYGSVISRWEESIKEKRPFSLHFNFVKRDGGKIKVKAESYVIKTGGEVKGFIGVVTPV